VDSRDSFYKPIGKEEAVKDEDNYEVESELFHEILVEESLIDEIFSSMAWNG
jgi:hypothetical protein